LLVLSIAAHLLSNLSLSISTLFPYTTLFRSDAAHHPPGSPSRARRATARNRLASRRVAVRSGDRRAFPGSDDPGAARLRGAEPRDRKSTRLNSSHVAISYAVFCLKKKK